MSDDQYRHDATYYVHFQGELRLGALLGPDLWVVVAPFGGRSVPSIWVTEEELIVLREGTASTAEAEQIARDRDHYFEWSLRLVETI